MNRFLNSALFMLTVAALALPLELFAAVGGGSRAAFTRIPLAGARYIAMGTSAESVVDDVYSIYWNPAGLAEILSKKKLSPSEITKKARQGKIDEINEQSLLRFSEDEDARRVVEIGVTGTLLDQERYGAFTGVAFNAGPGVLGIAGTSVFSTGIPTYNSSGVLTGQTNYVAAVAHFAYGWTMDIVSLGVSFKVLYEDIASYRYLGFGVDIGVRVQILPFLTLSLVAQDLGTGLFPLQTTAGVTQAYDFGAPTIRAGISLKTESGFLVSASVIKKTDLEPVEFGLALGYTPHEVITLYLGINDVNVSTGLTIRLKGFDVSYAFNIDSVNGGFNHTVSMNLVL